MKIKLIIFTLLFVHQLSAQDYVKSYGVRGGVSSGFSFQLFKDDIKALQANLSFRDNGMQATAIIQTYRPYLWKGKDNLYIYSGLGAHVGFTNKERAYFNISSNYTEVTNRFRPVVGVDAMFGLEYRVYTFPLAVTLDFKPFVEVFGEHFFRVNFWDFALGVKYTL